MDNDSLPRHFVGAGLPRSFRRRTVSIPPRQCRGYEASEWRDAIVLVRRGKVDVTCSDGTVLRFGEGDLLWLTGLPVRALCNPGEGEAVLVGIRRRGRGPRRLPNIFSRLGALFKKGFDDSSFDD